jgi:glucoamylase
MIFLILFFQPLCFLWAATDTWSAGNKQIFGTSYETYDSTLQYSDRSSTAPISKVWFTGAQGVLTELYWPTLDTAQVRDSQFLITDGHSFFVEERRDLKSTAEWLETGIPAYRVVNTDPGNRFQIEKIIFTDPTRDVVLQKIRITKNIPNLKFFILHNPSASNTPFGDFGRVTQDGLFAWQGRHAQALLTTIPMKKTVAGIYGQSNDGFQDIKNNYQLDAISTEVADGNVVLTAELNTSPNTGVDEFVIGIGFSSHIYDAEQLVRDSFRSGVDSLLDLYRSEWKQYQNQITNLESMSFDSGKLFRSSVALLKAMEDKSYAGAFVAAPTVPWGDFEEDPFGTYIDDRVADTNMVCGYHCVWPRDLFHMATGMIAIGDVSTAVASLNYLKNIQFTKDSGTWQFGNKWRSKDGSFPQNVWVNGDIHWRGLQMDQVSYPIILAKRLIDLRAISAENYWNMVERAADFVSEMGPWTEQDRWEEASGASPSTLAAEIAALKDAAQIAEFMGASDKARKYRMVADSWSNESQGLESWTFTHNGIYGDGQYFLRIVGSGSVNQSWNPNDDSWIQIANNGGRWLQKQILDGGFLELARLGVRDPNDKYILKTVEKYDPLLGVEIPGRGRSYYRYSKDRYNKNDLTGEWTAGMLWPMLTGERGYYEFLRKPISSKDRKAANHFIESMERFANSSFMLPEQVWDSGPTIGLSTGSATPLGWAHAEYLRLLRVARDTRLEF